MVTKIQENLVLQQQILFPVFQNLEEKVESFDLEKKDSKIISLFKNVKIDENWSFIDKTRKETSYLTHGYHRYPAKFIPQIAFSLIEKYTKKGDLIVDTFCGCGTTLVEAKVLGRNSIGVDINPVATLITGTKIIPINPNEIEKETLVLEEIIDLYDEKKVLNEFENERIDYWFKKEQKHKLTFLLKEIFKIENKEIQNFFLCAFSNILKNCSIWLQKSNKPTRDLNKKPSDPFKTFFKQVRAMTKSNLSFYEKLKFENNLDNISQVFCEDARKIPVENNSVDLIITSPPYVTSYEYADLHQLTALWFDYTKNLNDFRKRFIGTSYHEKKDLNLNSAIAENIKKELFDKNKKTSEEVANYFSEMNEVFTEMKRILKKGGKTCIVIGNTNLRSVEILNAEVFYEQLQNLGFELVEIIKREIPSKNLPSTRDKNTGRFAKITNENKVLIYPTEFILIMKKI